MASSKNDSSILLLYALSKLTDDGHDLFNVLNRALALMAKHLHMMRGAITLISRETGDIRIEASYGLNQDEEERGHYKRGEGITGSVIKMGEPMYVSNVSNEPRFLNKTQSRDLKKENIAFLCVPIRIQHDIIGALSVDQLSADTDSLESELRLLEIIAHLLGYAAMECQRRMDTIRAPQERIASIIGNSPSIKQTLELISQVAPADATVLLQGETGTGKELAAHAIHALSARSHAPFISLNCAALPENLIESELFGHEKGAFTGASSIRKGRFELAHTGTLFLDEIGELPLPTQAKLLRVLQTLRFERLGGMGTHHVDVRLICATNRDLSRMVEEGSFRRDLFFRINVFPILLPPLRERKSDLYALCSHFLKKKEPQKSNVRLSFEALAMLENYDFPGNVRELENILERALLLMGQENLILPEHLPDLSPALLSSPQNLRSQMDCLEKDMIVQQLIKEHGSMRHTAKVLGMTERILGLRMKKYGLNYKDFRPSKKSTIS